VVRGRDRLPFWAKAFSRVLEHLFYKPSAPYHRPIRKIPQILQSSPSSNWPGTFMFSVVAKANSKSIDLASPLTSKSSLKNKSKKRLGSL